MTESLDASEITGHQTHCSSSSSKLCHNSSQSFASTMLAGGIAGCVSKSAMAPLSRLTILYQVNSALYPSVESSGSASRIAIQHLNLFQLTRKIIQEEGISQLWKGNLMTILHRFPYSAINFSVYEISKDIYTRRTRSCETPLSRLFCGALGASAACTICYPLDLLRTRLTINVNGAQSNRLNVMSGSTLLNYIQNPGNVLHNSAIVQTFNDIVEREGVRGLYRGIFVSLLVCVPNLSIGFATYGTAKEHLLRINSNWFLNQKRDGLNVLGAMACGASSGITSSLLVFPADVIRRRMQVRGLTQNASLGKQEVLVTEEVWQLFRSEGVRGFYRGLIPELLKVTPAVGITFVTYEFVLGIFKR